MYVDPALRNGKRHIFNSAFDAELVPHFGEDSLEVAFGISEAAGDFGMLLAVGQTLLASCTSLGEADELNRQNRASAAASALSLSTAPRILDRCRG